MKSCPACGDATGHKEYMTKGAPKMDAWYSALQGTTVAPGTTNATQAVPAGQPQDTTAPNGKEKS